MDEYKDILEKYGISIYLRDGKWYWMIKSKSFEECFKQLRGSALAKITQTIIEHKFERRFLSWKKTKQWKLR